MDKKRQEFRKYLEATGVTEKLTLALMKLYQQENKPADPIEYIRKYLNGESPDDEEKLGEELQVKIDDFAEEKKKTEETDKEVEKSDAKKIENDVKKTESEIDLFLAQQYEALKADESGSSLLKEYLTDEILEKLKALTTQLKGGIYNNIRSGLTHFDSDIGIFASDQHAYSEFESLFAPVLDDFHDMDNDTKQPPMEFGEFHELDDLDPEGNFVKSIRVVIGRSLNDYAFMPLLSDKKLEAIEDKIRKNVLMINDEQFKGTYHSLSSIEDEQQKKWIEDGTMFPNADDKYLKEAQTFNHWPMGRGVFMNEKNNFRVWVNYEEHIQVISYEDGANLQSAYERLAKGFNLLVGDMEFAQHERYGFLAHNLKNIGNTMRIIAKVKISKLALDENSNKFESLLEAHHIKAHNLENGFYELMNIKRVGITEIDTARAFQKGIKEIITAEKCLYL